MLRPHRALRATNLLNVLRFSSTSEATAYDVVIHGGGVVGAAVAADLLSRTQGRCRICLIEAGAGARAHSSSQPDARVYALSPRSINYLDRLGAWQHVKERSHPYSSMQIWEASGPGLVKFRASDAKKTELGRICEDVTIQAALYRTIKEMGHSIDILHRSSILEIQLPAASSSSNLVNLVIRKTDGEVETEQRISTRLLVAADGANSLVRRLLGIPSWGWSYGQEAVVATVSLLPPPSSSPTAPATAPAGVDNSTAWQRYLPTGPLALLPCWGGYSSIVWSVPVQEARRLKALSPEAFLAELNAALRSPVQRGTSNRVDDAAFEGRARGSTIFPPWMEALLHAVEQGSGGLRQGPKQVLKGIGKELSAASEAVLAMAQLRDPYASPPLVQQLCSKRISFPLSLQQATHYAVQRCVLVGDAAHSIHPQAGQGLNLGLADAAALCSHVLKALETGQDIGQRELLQDYASERYAKNLAMMGIVDIINSTFKDSIVQGDHRSDGSDASSSAVHAKRLLRSVGMLGIHNSAMLKAEIAKFAMGTE